MRLNLVIVFVVCVISCAPTGEISKNFVYDSEDDVGIVALSIDCQGTPYAYKVTMGYNGATVNYLALNNPEIDSSCNEQHQIKLLNLKAGNYKILNLTVGFFSVQDFRAVNFTVLPHKLVYLGNFKIDVVDVDEPKMDFFLASPRVNLLISDQRNIDMPLIQQKLPNISIDSYIYSVARFTEK